MRFYSQQNEDQTIIKDIYKGKVPHNKKFIELGAMDGIMYSNTKFFEDNCGWTGILIEPVKHLYDQLVRNRPNSDCFNYAISETEGEVNYIGYHATSGMEHTMTIGHKSCWHKTQNKPYKVKSIPINKIVDKEKYLEIELFSVDVEGGEFEVLNTFDWDIDVNMVLIEISEIGEDNSKYKKPYHDLEKDQKCRDILKEKGFVFVERIGANDLWQNKKYRKDEEDNIV